MRKILILILTWIVNLTFNYIDSDKDGKISKKELEELNNKLKDFIKLVKSKIKNQ